jgi:hypothetical protein
VTADAGGGARAFTDGPMAQNPYVSPDGRYAWDPAAGTWRPTAGSGAAAAWTPPVRPAAPGPYASYEAPIGAPTLSRPAPLPAGHRVRAGIGGGASVVLVIGFFLLKVFLLRAAVPAITGSGTSDVANQYSSAVSSFVAAYKAAGDRGSRIGQADALRTLDNAVVALKVPSQYAADVGAVITADGSFETALDGSATGTPDLQTVQLTHVNAVNTLARDLGLHDLVNLSSAA